MNSRVSLLWNVNEVAKIEADNTLHPTFLQFYDTVFFGLNAKWDGMDLGKWPTHSHPDYWPEEWK